ncbi:MAG: carbohydrate ABC transporter permease [Planctomycetes bacterium]|nr:carbohydrate ABC transporter permease [Planctomycetota bacterium]
MTRKRCTISGAALLVLGALWCAPLIAVVWRILLEHTSSVPLQSDPAMMRALLVGVLVSCVSAVLSCAFSGMAGYAFSQKRFYCRDVLFGALAGAMFFPPVVMMAPLFRITAWLGIYDTLAALILPSSVTAFSVVFMKVAVDRVSPETIDSAKIDGAGEVAVFTKIVIPLVRGPLLALFALQFLATWGALAVPWAVVDSPRHYTLSLRLAVAIQQLNSVPEAEVLWSAGLIAVPALVLFAFKARDIIRGAMGALFRYE